MNATMQKTTKVECDNCGTRNRVPAVAQGMPRCGKCSAPLRWVVDATDDEFHAVVDESGLPVLVDVWAPWCGPCRRVSPTLEKLAGELAGKLKLVKVNAETTRGEPAVRGPVDPDAAPPRPRPGGRQADRRPPGAPA